MTPNWNAGRVLAAAGVEGGIDVDKADLHTCGSCKGTGKIVSQRTGLRQGVKRSVEFLVDCPAKLTEQYLLNFPDPEADKMPRLRC